MAKAQLGPAVRYLRGLAIHSQDRADSDLLSTFLSDNDQPAFAALMRRHGPMVLAVCRRALGNEADADDAFQATFLVLARRAASIRNRESLAGWLHGVAHRMAHKSRRAADRRRKHEARSLPASPAKPEWAAAWREVQALLDAEIACLPAIYREPFVLCCLESQSCAEVARKLGHKEGTVWSRVARARKLLQQRLGGRGITLTSALAAVAIANDVTAAVPPELASATVRAAARIGTGPLLGNVSMLLKGESKLMLGTKLKALTVLLFVTGFIIAGFWATNWQDAAAQERPVQKPKVRSTVSAPAGAPEANGEDGEMRTIRGRVVGPDGSPLAGAKIYYWAGKAVHPRDEVRATTGADGKFQFTVKQPRNRPEVVVARAEGLGSDWISLGKPSANDEVTLRPAREVVPISGRILSQEGKPVEGVSVQIVRAGKLGKGDLAGWFQSSVKWLEKHRYVMENELATVPGTLTGVTAERTTDKGGCFRLEGAGADRVLVLDVSGPGIGRVQIFVASLPRLAKDDRAGTTGLYGPTFEHIVGPARVVEGTVLDKETGKPLTGVLVVGRVPRMGYARGWEVKAVTDAKGNYRLEGLAKDQEYHIIACGLKGQAYLPREEIASDAEGLKPLRVDFALDRGTFVEGRLVDRDTGKPVRGTVHYYPMPGNDRYKSPLRGKMVTLLGSQDVGKDGTFKLLVSPGPGVVRANGLDESYVPAVISPEDKRRGVGDYLTVEYEEVFAMVPTAGHANRFFVANGKGEGLRFDLTLVKGHRATGSVLDPDGRPAGKILGGVLRANLSLRSAAKVKLDGQAGMYSASGLDPRVPQTLVFYQPEHGLVSHVEARGGAKELPAAHLQPWGKVQGRLLDPDGKPLVGARVGADFVDREGNHFHVGFGPLSKPIAVDGKGRFQMEGFVPGLTFKLHILDPRQPNSGLIIHEIGGLTFTAGQTRELADLRIKLPRIE
jgi:RNA polymerase sigma factor (sigma-70 family)